MNASRKPRTGSFAWSKLEEDPRLVAMWAGYAFALDFREERGHVYMLEDQTFTGRQPRPQPGSCFNCHTSTHLAYKRAGDGDISKGFEKLNPLSCAEARPSHPFCTNRFVTDGRGIFVELHRATVETSLIEIVKRQTVSEGVGVL